MNNESKKRTLLTTPAPHLKQGETTRSIMIKVMIALLPATLWGISMFGKRALVITLVSVVCSVLFEYLYQRVMRKPITVNDGSAALTGLVIGLSLPVSIPVWMPVLAAFFAIVIVKQVFGGIGKNIVNPAVAAKALLLVMWPKSVSLYTKVGAKLPLFANVKATEGVVADNPLIALKNGHLPDVDVVDAFIGEVSGCIGEVSALMILLGGIYLLCRGVIKLHIPAAYIGTVAFLTFMFPKVTDAGPFMLHEVLCGGLIFGAFFMATDCVTTPITNDGKLIYGIGCGALTVLFRYYTPYDDGVVFAILIMNVLARFIDMLNVPKRFGGKKKKA